METEITNRPALRLYENLGFVRDKRLFRYYLNGVDALRLKLWLRWDTIAWTFLMKNTTTFLKYYLYESPSHHIFSWNGCFWAGFFFIGELTGQNDIILKWIMRGFFGWKETHLQNFGNFFFEKFSRPSRVSCHNLLAMLHRYTYIVHVYLYIVITSFRIEILFE